MKLLNRNVIGYAGLVVAVAWLVFYLKQVDISLIYYWQQTVPLSLAEYLEYPGGFSNLLAARFNELLTKPFWGTVAVITMISVTYLLLHKIFNRFKEVPFYHSYLLASIIPLVLLFISYKLPTELTLGFFIGLVIAGLHTLYSPGNQVMKLLYIFLTSIITYLLAGPVGLAVFLQVCLVRIIRSGKYSELIAAVPLLLVIPPVYLLFNQALTLKQALLGSLIVSKYDEVPAIFFITLSLPIILMILFFGIQRLFSKAGQNRIVLLERIAIALVTAALVFSSLWMIDRETRSILQIEQASFNDNWRRVLELADEELLQNEIVQFEVNRALFHKGVLLEEVFRYPQIFGEQSIFLVQVFSGRNGTHVSDFYADLGFANESRHWADESHMIMMRQPIIFKQLILSYLAMGKQDIAVKYLGVLSRSTVHKAWCDQILGSVKQNTLEGIPYLKAFANNDPENDFFPSPSQPIQSLSYFYMVNPNNRAAFEFLMASYMLKHQVGPVISHIQDFTRFGYSSLPRSIEEAVMVYLNRTKSKSLDLSGYNISRETVTEFQDFTQLVAKSKNITEAKTHLAKYKQTYWYYILYSSPYAKKSK